MIEVKNIRENIKTFIDGLTKRGLSDAKKTLEEIIVHDDKRKMLKTNLDGILTDLNQVSKQIGEKIQSGEKEEAELMKKKSQELKTLSKKISEDLKKEESIIFNILTTIPNIPENIVPAGNNEEDNTLIFESKIKKNDNIKLSPHWEIIKKYNIIDFEKGNKITGAGFPIYIDKGAKLQRAIINFCLDQAVEKGYQEIQPPVLVNDSSAFGTGQLPDKEGQMYKIENEDLFMIPTAEVPITNLHRNEIYDVSSLPIKNVAYTPCFRKEAGSWGAHVRGLNRLHQFDKVEIVQIESQENSNEALHKMCDHVENLIKLLELPYRKILLCSGDLGFSASITYDFEVYAPGQKKWLECSSVSNFKTYQTNRMNIKFKTGTEKKLAHSLNGSALALPRIVAAILENNQEKDKIHIPKVLQPYTGFNSIS